MKASIVIPAYQPAELLRQCLQGIINFTDLSDVEVIVVCNGSDRYSAEMVLDLGGCFKLVWYPEALGFTRAANIGFGLAVADQVIVMNTDSHLLLQERDEWINRLLAPFSNEKVGIAGLGCMWTEFGMFTPFFCTAIRRSLFDELGYLDEAFSPGYSEDADFCYRVRAAGYDVVSVSVDTPDHVRKINISDFPISHAGEGSFTDKALRAQYTEKGMRILYEKWGKK